MEKSKSSKFLLMVSKYGHSRPFMHKKDTVTKKPKKKDSIGDRRRDDGWMGLQRKREKIKIKIYRLF